MGEWVDSDGVRLAVEVVGEGDPVTLVAHGITQSRYELSLLAPFIPGTKVLFDFRGHGESDSAPRGGYAMDDFAADVDNVARTYGATRVVGASLGGGATLRLLRRDPDRFERLVILLPARLGSDAASRGVRERLLRMADMLERYPLEEAARRIVETEEADGLYLGFNEARSSRLESIKRMNADGIPHAIRQALDDPPVTDFEPIRRVTAPTLVVGQEGDPVHAAHVARELAGALPNAELLLYPDPPSLIRDIPVLVARVGAFLAT